jgi:hypothetical protein
MAENTQQTVRKRKIFPNERHIAFPLSRLALIVPPFAAYLVYPATVEEAFFTTIIELQLIFVSAVLTWGGLRQLVLIRISESFREYSPFGRFSFTALIIGLIVLLLASLTAFRMRCSDALFLYTLGALTLGGTAELLEKNKRTASSRFLFFLFFWSICYISFLIRLGMHLWQPVIFSIGPAAICLLIRLSTRVSIPESPHHVNGDVSEEAPAPKPTREMRFVALLAIVATMGPAILAYTGQLPSKYLITFGILPLLPPSIALFRSPGGIEVVSQKVANRLQLIGVLYMSLLIAARLL